MADIQEASLYDRDFYQWAQDQARAVRNLRDAAARPGNNLPAALEALDWDNLVEELDGLAKGVRSELTNRIVLIIEHLVKLELSPANDPRRGWEETVQRSRLNLGILLDGNPSLRREIPMILGSPIPGKVARFTVDDLIRRGETPIGTAAPAYTQAQILEDWWPRPPDASP